MSIDDELLGAAAAALIADGPHALSLRRIAEAAGTSTQAVYTRFGSKAGLADALYLQGFEALARSLATVALPDDPVERIVSLSAVYRRVALDRPHHYALMTGRPIPDYVPPAASLRVARQTLQPLVEAVAAAVDAGVLDGDPEQLAHRFWAVGHGRISLEINGFLPVDDTEYEELCRHVIDGHRSP